MKIVCGTMFVNVLLFPKIWNKIVSVQHVSSLK